MDPSWLLLTVHQELFCSFFFCVYRTRARFVLTFEFTLEHRQYAGSGGGDEFVPLFDIADDIANPSTDTNAGDRQVGRRAQLSNITAAKTYDPLPVRDFPPRMILKLNNPLVWPTLSGHVSVPRPC